MVAQRAFENTAKLKYSGITAIHKNVIHDKIMSRLNLGNSRLNFRNA